MQRRAEFVSKFAEGAALAPYASGALAVPVFVGERLAGAMGFPFQQPDAITAEVRALARIAADLGGQALERAGLYELERSSRESLDRVLAVAPRFQQGATLEAVVVSICAEARRAFGCDVVQIWTPVDDVQLEVAWRDPPSDVIPPGPRVDFADFPGLIEEMRAFRSMFVPNAQLKTRGEALRHAQRLGLYSSLRIPIVIGARFERILALQWEREIPEPAPSVIAVMRRFADQAGLAMEQAERRRAQEETRELQAVTEALAAAATPSDVGLAIVRQGVKALGARAATVYALREDGGGLDLIASEGYPPETMSAWEQIPLEVQTPLTDAIRSGEIIVCASPEEIAARYPWFDDSDQSFVAAPLVAAGRVIGGIFIGSGEARQYGGNLSLIVSLARQAGQALDRAQLFERERASVGRLRKLQAVTAALSQAVTVEDVSRTCLEHATTGRRRPRGPRRPPRSRRRRRARPCLRRLGDRARGPGRRDPGRGRAGRSRRAFAAAGRPRSTTAGSRSRSPAVRSRCSCPRAAHLGCGSRVAAHPRQPGRAGRSTAPAATRPSAGSPRRCNAASSRSACRRSAA